MTTSCISTICMRSTGSTWSRRLSADPKATSALAQSISPWPLSSPGYFKDLQNRLKKFVESGQLGPFKNGYWGSRPIELPPEANLMAVAHYLEALDFQKEIVKIHTIFGGKNPHPNWLVGGVPCPINVDGIGAVGAINMERLNLRHRDHRPHRSNSSIRSICPTCWPSARSTRTGSMAAACRARSCWPMATCRNTPMIIRAPNLLLPRGAIINGNLNEIHPVDLRDPGRDPGIRDPFLVQISRRDQGPASLGRRHRAELSSSGPTPRARGPISRASTRAANIPGSRRRAGRAMRWKSGRSPAGSSATPRASRSSRSRSTSVLKELGPAGDRPVLDAGPHGGARAGVPMGRLQDAAFPEQADRQHQGRRQLHRQCREMGPEDLADRGQGRRLHRGAARRAGALDQDQGRQDRQLPVRRADHLERQPARPQGQYRRLRGLADGHADGRSRPAARDPAHPAFLRSLPRLLDPCDERGRSGNGQGRRCADADVPSPARGEGRRQKTLCMGRPR